jgi:hypothetical protein
MKGIGHLIEPRGILGEDLLGERLAAHIGLGCARQWPIARPSHGSGCPWFGRPGVPLVWTHVASGQFTTFVEIAKETLRRFHAHFLLTFGRKARSSPIPRSPQSCATCGRSPGLGARSHDDNRKPST